MDIRTSHAKKLHEAGVAQNQFLSTVVPVKGHGDPAMAADADVFCVVSILLYVAVLYNDVFEVFMQWGSLQRAYKPTNVGAPAREYLLIPDDSIVAWMSHPDPTWPLLVQTTHGWQIPPGLKV